MKSLCLALALCLTLTACGPRGSEPTPTGSPQGSSPAEETARPSESANAPVPEIGSLGDPPALTVSTLYHADSVVAACGNFQWAEEMPDGTVQSIVACGASPMDAGWEKPLLYTAFGPGTLPPPKEGEFVSSIMPIYYLDFGEVPPTAVTARRWSADYIGQDDAWDRAEAVSVETTDEGYALYPLGDGEFVYEVNAQWGELGSAQYVFQTIPQVRGEK